ncbi:Conserved_hypothetical protein [Hexamita inflata]|uniref:CCHC-type domain-containing protein n=1 Tax=Hexamita inflata TaxID=28002 RepID=A0AA86PDA6_9EUKA|nr:Conserved hypothetical protein [Hexamita inflata]
MNLDDLLGEDSIEIKQVLLQDVTNEMKQNAVDEQSTTSSKVFSNFDDKTARSYPVTQRERYFNKQICEFCGDSHHMSTCPKKSQRACYFCGKHDHETSSCKLNNCQYCGRNHRCCRDVKAIQKNYAFHCFRCGQKHPGFLCCLEQPPKMPNGKYPPLFCVYCGDQHSVYRCREKIAPASLYMQRRQRWDVLDELGVSQDYKHW